MAATGIKNKNFLHGCGLHKEDGGSVNNRYYLTVGHLYFGLVTKLKHEGMSLDKISRADQRHS